MISWEKKTGTYSLRYRVIGDPAWIEINGIESNNYLLENLSFED